MSASGKRLYEIDLIKLIAMLSVFTVHYTVEMMYLQVNALAQVFPTDIFHVYLGTFGVSLFFIASGASLYYVHGKSFEPRNYFKKRFMSIYPMFWMAYILILVFHVIVQTGLPQPGVPAWKIIYTITGIDGTMLYYGPNFYQTGEWFLGVIIGIYLLFPLILFAFKKSVLFISIAAAAVLILFILFYEGTMPLECVVFVRVPEFLFGMILMKYRHKLRMWHIIPAAGIIALISIIPAEPVNVMIRNIAVGASAFTIMVILFAKIPDCKAVRILSSFGGRYAYAFFLVHHVIILYILGMHTGNTLTRKEVYLYYILCLALSALCTKLLFMLHKSIIRRITRRKNEQQ